MTADTPIEPRDRTPRAELWLYFWAATSYIAAGFLVKQIFAWWWFGAIWFVGFVWLVPHLTDRLRGRTDREPAVEEQT